MGQNKDQVKLLVHAGADVNYRADSGSRVIHRAVQKPSVEIADILIMAGANINLQTNTGDTPLHCALKSEYLGSSSMREIVTLLLEAGADVSARDAAGMTALDLASHQDLPLVMSLLEAGVDPKEQWVTFLNAVSRGLSFSAGHLEVAQWLIDRGYDINSGREVAKARPNDKHAARACNALLFLAANGPDNPERLAFSEEWG